MNSYLFLIGICIVIILSFFAIPDSVKNAGIESGFSFVVIIATSIIMAMSLITDSRKNKSVIKNDK